MRKRENDSRLKWSHVFLLWGVCWGVVIWVIMTQDVNEDGLLIRAHILKGLRDGLAGVNARLGRMVLETESAYWNTMDAVRR